MASLFRTIFRCCLCGSETDNQDEPERQRLLDPPGDNNQVPPEVIPSGSTVPDDQRHTALKQRLNNIVSNASHGMRSAPSQYGTYSGAASVGQTPSSSNVPQQQLPAGAQVSRMGSRKSLASNRPQAQAQASGGAETSSAEAPPTANVAPSSVSNLTHRVRTSLPGPGSGSAPGAGAGGSGTSSPLSPDQQHRPHGGEEPERGRRMSGIKDVLDRPGRRPSMVSSNPASKPVSKDPYARRESMDIPSPNGRSPSYAKTNGGVGSFKIPQDDELILQYD